MDNGHLRVSSSFLRLCRISVGLGHTRRLHTILRACTCTCTANNVTPSAQSSPVQSPPSSLSSNEMAKPKPNAIKPVSLRYTHITIASWYAKTYVRRLFLAAAYPSPLLLWSARHLVARTYRWFGHIKDCKIRVTDDVHASVMVKLRQGRTYYNYIPICTRSASLRNLRVWHRGFLNLWIEKRCSYSLTNECHQILLAD